MRLTFIQLLLFAAFAALGPPGAAAQTRPGLWEISVEAAAAAGPDSPVAPVILGNTLALAEERDPDGVRPVLSRLLLMLSSIAQNRFDLFTRVLRYAQLQDRCFDNRS